MLKIAITRQMTGKTTLARQLAAHYNTLWVPEYARFYLMQLERPYTSEDVLEIAKGQLHWENELAKLTQSLLICDTDLIVIKIWLKFKYNLENEWVEAQLKSKLYDLHFLCGIDLPWQDDPLRENPNLQDREILYDLYKAELQLLNIPFFEILGSQATRLQQAITIIEKFTR